jgi:hypothetical protein
MQRHGTECSDTSSQTLVLADLPGDKQRAGKFGRKINKINPHKIDILLRIVGEVGFYMLRIVVVELVVEHLEAEEAHLLGNDTVVLRARNTWPETIMVSIAIMQAPVSIHLGIVLAVVIVV